MKSASIWW